MKEMMMMMMMKVGKVRDSKRKWKAANMKNSLEMITLSMFASLCL
jgi:hypothetical protein